MNTDDRRTRSSVHEPLRGTLGNFERLERYRAVAARLFPDAPTGYPNTWPGSDLDLFTLGLFVETWPFETILLDVGTPNGLSAFFFASQPKVREVVSVGVNLKIAEEVSCAGHAMGSVASREALREIRALDVARGTLEKFPYERGKIRLDASVPVGAHYATSGIEAPALDSPDGVSTLAFLHRSPTRNGVRSDLEEIFEKNPRCVVLLAGCRGEHGPYVQAGVVDFLEDVRRVFHFRLLGDLAPGPAASGLGVVFPDEELPPVEYCLAALGGMFTRRLDLLRLLQREEELIGIASAFREELTELRLKNANLEKGYEKVRENNEALEARYSKQRYRIMDGVGSAVLRAVKRGKPPRDGYSPPG